MRKMIKGALALGLAATCLAVPASANHYWGNYHWARTSNPFTLKLGDNLTGAWKSYLVTSNADWSESAVLDTVIVAGNTRARQCRGTNGMVQVCNAAYGNNGWLGIASISIANGDHITQGTVKLNDTYYSQAQYNTPAWRNLVMCQEIGHTFGLGHQDENFDNANLNTCMDYTSNPASNQHPNQHDYDLLVDIYSHLDSTTTVGMSAFRPRNRNIAAEEGVEIGNGPKSWGRPIKFSRAGKPNTYLRVDGPGRMTITHVFWVPGMGPEHNHED